MGKFVIFDLDGTLDQGISITLEIWAERELGTSPLIQARLKGKLPPAPELIEQYQQWRSHYRQLSLLFRLGDRPNVITHGSHRSLLEDCQKFAHTLVAHLNTWLTSPTFRLVRELLLEKLQPAEPIRLVLQTADPLLRRLPWHQWDLLQRYSQVEVTLGAPVYEQVEPPPISRTQIRILAILGNRNGINIEADRQLLTHLPDQAETIFLVEPDRQTLQQQLRDEQGWDILFFAGHSTSQDNAQTGQIEISHSDRLSLDELTYALKTAIAHGLKLAIFNSCDGLGLVHHLERLHIPQVIVMREPVPDRVAQAFLKYFLESFSNHQPLHLAVRAAREQLQAFEADCPSATWLPILCQNPSTPPLSWQSLTSPSHHGPGLRLRPANGSTPHSAPYLGLSAFQESDAPFFFGREAIAHRLAETLQQQPLLPIIGPSGSGKSSLVFAGIIPPLRQLQSWAIARFRPGDRPFFRLAEQLILLLEPALSQTDQLIEINKLAIALQQGDVTLADVGERIVQRSAPAKRLLLVADQFEELYSLCPEAEQSPFLDMLLSALQAPSFRLVFTLRADFCEQLLAHRHMAAALQQFPPELLGPMTRAELQAAIEKPAIAHGTTLAEGLSERILDAVESAPGHLPLLEFALTLLWEQQSHGYLTHAAYDAIGGIERALASYADQVYSALEPTAQQQAQRILTQLIHPGNGTADTRRLASRAEIGETSWHWVKYLADARLVVSRRDEATGEEGVELAHEALIQEWQRLRQWIADDRSFRVWQERLRETVRQWQRSQQDEGILLRGAPLLEAEHWQQTRQTELSLTEQEFIQASLAFQHHEQKLRDRQQQWRWIGLSAGVTTALFLGAIAFGQWQRAEVAQTNTQLEALTASAVELFDTGKELEALLEAVRAGKQLAWMTESNPDTRIKLTASLQQMVYAIREYNRLDGHDRTIIDASFSSDGQLIASASDDRTVKLWQRDGTLIATLEGHGDRVRSVAFSPDGQILASGSYDRTVRLWRRDGQAIARLEAEGHQVNSVHFSPDGLTLAAARTDGRIQLWQRDAAGQWLSSSVLTGQQGWATAVRFSPDGALIASTGTDGTVNLWSREGSLLTTLRADSLTLNHLSFSPNSQLLAAAANDGSVWLWEWQNGRFSSTPRLRFQAHGDRIWGVTFSADGQTLTTASADNTVRLWQLDGTPLQTLTGHSSSVYSVSYSPDGRLLASSSADQTIRLWQPQRRSLDLWRETEAPVTAMQFDQTEKILATATSAGTVQLWPADRAEPTVLSLSQDAITAIDFSPDGQAIATASVDTFVQLWSRSGELLQTLAGEAPVVDVSFSPDGQLLAAASADHTVKLWQRRPNGTFPEQPTQVLQNHRSWVTSIAFSPNGQRLASSSDDDTVNLWQRSAYGSGFSSEPVHTLVGHTSRVNQVRFSADGQVIATASDDGYVKLWQTDGTLRITLSGHNERVSQVAFSPNGALLASATVDGTVKLWSLRGNLLRNLRGHQGSISAMLFSPDGNMLVSGSTDQTVILWNLDLEDLLSHSCTWLSDYLQTNATVTGGDRRHCFP